MNNKFYKIKSENMWRIDAYKNGMIMAENTIDVDVKNENVGFKTPISSPNKCYWS